MSLVNCVNLQHSNAPKTCHTPWGLQLLRWKWSEECDIILPSLEPGGWSAHGQPQVGVYQSSPDKRCCHIAVYILYSRMKLLYCNSSTVRLRKRFYTLYKCMGFAPSTCPLEVSCWVQDQIHGFLKSMNDQVARDYVGFSTNIFKRLPYYQFLGSILNSGDGVPYSEGVGCGLQHWCEMKPSLRATLSTIVFLIEAGDRMWRAGPQEHWLEDLQPGFMGRLTVIFAPLG